MTRRASLRLSTLCGPTVVACAAAAVVTACRSPVGQRDEARSSRTCPQTYEFGNTGCVEVIGQVVGLRGQPLTGISVGLRHTSVSEAPGQAFSSAFTWSDSAGAFRLRAMRMVGRPPRTGPDTISLWVHGADPRSSGVGVPARVRDSVLVVGTVSPVGAVPEPTVVRLVLPAP